MRKRRGSLFVVLMVLVFPLDLKGQAQCSQAPKKVEEVLEVRGMPVMFVENVVPGSVAAAAGVSRFDLIVGFNGQDMRRFPTAESFLAELRIAAITDRADMEVLKYDASTGTHSPSRIMVTLAGSTEHYLGLRSSFAYVVAEVAGGGMAEKMGLTPGDFIEEVDGKQVANLRGPHDLDITFQDIAARPGKQFTLTSARWTPTEDGGRKGKTRKLKGSF